MAHKIPEIPEGTPVLSGGGLHYVGKMSAFNPKDQKKKVYQWLKLNKAVADMHDSLSTDSRAGHQHITFTLHELGISLRELARRMNRSRDYLRRIENGLCRQTPEIARELLQELKRG